MKIRIQFTQMNDGRPTIFRQGQRPDLGCSHRPPSKQTSTERTGMSALCQKQTFGSYSIGVGSRAMSPAASLDVHGSNLELLMSALGQKQRREWASVSAFAMSAQCPKQTLRRVLDI